MKLHIITSMSIFIVLLFTGCNSKAQNNRSASAISKTSIEVIQFHSEHRCTTCLKIEELTRETLKSYPQIIFKLVNVEDKTNEKMATQFEATGTALFLYNPKNGKKKELTNFAFMNVGDKDKYIKELKKQIDEFLKL